MATLNSTFRLFDGYTRTADKVISKTDQATNKILKASGATDKFNAKLNATGASAGKASSGLGKYISIAALYMASLKGMGIEDNYTNTGARLKLINDGLQTQAELQDKIMASANRSRGAYGEMAAAIGKMGINAADAFGSNNELIAFTELVQKSFKVGGATSGEQSSAMLQLTQAMSAGVLQGDEFRSIADAAPLILNAVARYTGKSRGELKKLAAEGYITSEMMKNAMFMASKEINGQFATMPMTFTDTWNRITNNATDAFGPLMKRISNIINGDKFQKILDKIEIGLYRMAAAADKALSGMIGIYNYVSSNWSKIAPIIEGVTLAWLAYKGMLLLVQSAQWLVNMATFANPIGLIVLLIAVLIGAFVMLWEKCAGFRKFWAEMWMSNLQIMAVSYNSIAILFNLFRGGWNNLIDSMHFFTTALKIGMIASVLITKNAISSMIDSFSLLVDMMGTNIAAYNAMAKVFGMKTIDFKVTSKSLNGVLDNISGRAVGAINDAFSGVDGSFDSAKIDKPMNIVDLEAFGKATDALGKKIEDFTVSGWLKGLFGEASGALNSLLPDENDSPTTVKGLGNGGAVKVDMSDEDLQYLRDIAERDYINKFTNNALAPNVVIQFGDVHEEADANKVAGRIKKILQEEIAMTAEGAY